MRELLLRHITLHTQEDIDRAREQFLVKSLNIPASWLHMAKVSQDSQPSELKIMALKRVQLCFSAGMVILLP